MNRRSILIVAGALVVVALLLGAWFWLFSKGVNNTGVFGGAGTQKATSTITTGSQTNIPTATGGTQTGAGTNIPLGGQGGQGGVGVPGSVGSIFGTSTVGVTTGGFDNVSGVDWLGGTGAGGSSGAQTTTFVPSAINQLNNGASGGQVTILGTGNSSPSVDPQYGALFTAAGLGVALCTAAPLAGAVTGLLASGVSAVAFVPVTAPAQNIKDSDELFDRFLSCIARTVGRAIVDQITASVVNWINGGFRGSPSFVQNYQQFFANVADQAAGEYIKGSALSFLCSPFQLQVRIAIAQSYARRNAAASCTLSGVTRNVNNFLNGNFSAGGWPGLLSFTSIPTNNPFGAYAYAQIGLSSAQQRALSTANRNITPGGFIGYTQTYGCTAGGAGTDNQYINTSQFLTPTQSAAQLCPSNCKCKTATPGSIIENSLTATQNSTLNQLNLAKSFDEIISALITQLMTRTLQQGLSNLSGTNGYESNFLTPDQQQAQAAGNAFLAELQLATNVAKQYGQIEQGSVSDLQNAQSQLAALMNCQELKNQLANASTTQNAILALEVQVAVHNNNITRANQGIAALETLQTQLLSITGSADLAKVKQNYQTAIASGVIITEADVTLASQDRTTLQSQLAARNQQTTAEYTQCQQTP